MSRWRCMLDLVQVKLTENAVAQTTVRRLANSEIRDLMIWWMPSLNREIYRSACLSVKQLSLCALVLIVEE